MTRTKLGTLIPIVVLAGACQETASPTTSDVPQGLSIFSQSRDRGLTGMYAEGESVVFFETMTLPITQQDVDHFAAHGMVMTRPRFSTRWTDAEGRAVAQDGDWEDTADFAPPEKWEVTLDLTRKASFALREQVMTADVREEQLQLVNMAAAIPEAAQRVAAPTEEELAQIRAREAKRSYLGYSWRSYYYVRKPSGLNFHQGSSWDNHRYYSGAWHFYNSKLRDNGVPVPDYECSGAYSGVQDYKTYAANDSSIAIGGNGQCYNDGSRYGMCSLPWEKKFNCRSEALRQQVWVLGNVACFWATGMCSESQGITGGGAYCGIRTTCATRAGC